MAQVAQVAQSNIQICKYMLSKNPYPILLCYVPESLLSNFRGDILIKEQISLWKL